MRIVAWVVSLPVTLIVVSFALSNRQGVDLALWPLAEIVTAPLYLAVLAALLLGVAVGWLLIGPALWRARAQTRVQTRRGAAQDREIAELKRQRDEARKQAAELAAAAAAPPFVPAETPSSGVPLSS